MPRTSRPTGYTIVELLVVISIIVILAGTSIGGMTSLLRSSRFDSAFNRPIGMIQQARSLAAVGKDDEVSTYRVEIDAVAGKILLTTIDKATGAETEIDAPPSLQATTGLSYSITTGLQSSQPCQKAAFIFANKTDALEFECTTNAIAESILSPSPHVLIVTLKDANTARAKSFSISAATGIAQPL